ncbi:MAG: hypothetical protein IJ626_04725 [Muribaculaceae bacterium]|nr:hypothetical protein [Muribaculaceae bacterium]
MGKKVTDTGTWIYPSEPYLDVAGDTSSDDYVDWARYFSADPIEREQYKRNLYEGTNPNGQQMQTVKWNKMADISQRQDNTRVVNPLPKKVEPYGYKRLPEIVVTGIATPELRRRQQERALSYMSEANDLIAQDVEQKQADREVQAKSMTQPNKTEMNNLANLGLLIGGTAALAPSLYLAPFLTLSAFAGGVAGDKLGDLAVRKVSDNKYNRWGELMENITNGYIRADNGQFTNPLALLGGGAGAKMAHITYNPVVRDVASQAVRYPIDLMRSVSDITSSMAKDIGRYGVEIFNNPQGFYRPYVDQIKNGYQGWKDVQTREFNPYDIMSLFESRRYRGKGKLDEQPLALYSLSDGTGIGVGTDRGIPIVHKLDDLNCRLYTLTQDGPNSMGFHIPNGAKLGAQRGLVETSNKLPPDVFFGDFGDYDTQTVLEQTAQWMLDFTAATGRPINLFNAIQRSKMTPSVNIHGVDPLSPYSYSWIQRKTAGPWKIAEPRYANAYMEAFNNQAPPDVTNNILNRDNLTQIPVTEQLEQVNKLLTGRKAFIGLDGKLNIPIIRGLTN